MKGYVRKRRFKSMMGAALMGRDDAIFTWGNKYIYEWVPEKPPKPKEEEEGGADE